MKPSVSRLAVATVLVVAPFAHAHVSFDAGNAYANTRYVAVANIPHGCSDLGGDHYDTLKIEIEIPAEMTSVRPEDAVFGPASVETDVEGNVTKLIWEKGSAAQPADTHLYRVAFRGRLPNAPLTTLAFRTTQTCAEDTSTVWEDTNAPTLKVLPTRAPGWNTYTAQEDMDLETIQAFFADAQIVWANDMAYSANPVTAAMIESPLTLITAGTEYWVKY